MSVSTDEVIWVFLLSQSAVSWCASSQGRFLKVATLLALSMKPFFLVKVHNNCVRFSEKNQISLRLL